MSSQYELYADLFPGDSLVVKDKRETIINSDYQQICLRKNVIAYIISRIDTTELEYVLSKFTFLIDGQIISIRFYLCDSYTELFKRI